MSNWKSEFSDADSMYEALLATRRSLAAEMSKNAYVSVTGKSLNTIKADGIFEMVSKLVPESDAISVTAINGYAENLDRKSPLA